MPGRHSKVTIISSAVICIGLGALLHEGLGHGVTAWLRGDVVTQLTSNHLSDVRPDRLVDAGGTIVNLIAGAAGLLAARRAGNRANLRYFLWFFAAVNLLDAAGYFMFSGILGVGDWQAVIAGLPHQVALRTAMTIFGAALYILFVRLIGVACRPFVAARGEYNTVARLPYLAACIFYCIAGAFDPLGIRLLLISTIPAALGGHSGLLWADALMPRTPPVEPLAVKSSRGWLWAAVIFGCAFVAILGHGVNFRH